MCVRFCSVLQSHCHTDTQFCTVYNHEVNDAYVQRTNRPVSRVYMQCIVSGMLIEKKTHFALRLFTNIIVSPKRQAPAEKEAKPIKAVAVLTGSGTVHGNVTFVQKGCGEPVLLTVYVTGLQPNGSFGFHVHEKGDLLHHCTSFGGHYNPDKVC